MKSIFTGLKTHQSVTILINGRVGKAFKIHQTITEMIMKHYKIIFINLGEYLLPVTLFFTE